MPIYRVQAPDGNVYKIEGPANANHEDLFRTIAEQNPMAAKTTQELQSEKSAPTSISDIARSFGTGVVGAGKSLVDVFGAGSDTSKYLGEVAEGLQKGITPERQAEMARRAELSKRAEKEGLWSEIKSGLAGVAEAPLQSIAQGVGSALPTIAAGLVALPEAAPAALALGVQRASQVLIAAAQGTGEVKGDIHDTIKQAYKDKGMDDAQADKLAIEAQEYTLKNAPLLIGGAAFGALDALTGFEKSTSQALKNALTPEKKAFTKEGLQAAIAQLPEKAVQAPTYLGQAVKTGFEEAIPEGLQGGYGQLAQNLAMSQAGFETPTFQGVAGAAARDALVGALTGTAMSPLGHSVAHAEFEADKYLRGVKAEQELQTQREEFAKQQEQTKENLGVNKTLALGYEPKAEEEKYTNPAATITKKELMPEEVKFVDDYRKQNGLPPLKSYSIEDIKDAMPGVDPEGEQGRIDSILAAKYGYKPVDDNTGKPVNYTPDDVISAAEHEKNIATGTKGFADFLTRTTGSSDLNTMTQPQLFAAFQAIKQMPESEEKQILPEGTGASRFTDKQYKKAVSWFGQTFEQFDNKPLSRDTIIQDIQEATGLEQKHDAEALLDTAVKNGDLAETEEQVFRTYDDNGKLVSTYRDKAKADAAAKKQGLNVKEERLKQLTPPPAAEPSKRANLPAGYAMTKETVKEGEIPAGFEIYPEGRGKALVTVPTEAELQAKVESLTGARKKEADKTLANMNRDISTLKKARESLESMEARGEVGSQAYELAKTRLAKQERVLGKRIERHKERIEGYQAPLKTRPTEAKKQVTREKITVTKGGKSLGSFPDNVKAQEAILVQMTDEELAATASDDRLGAIADRAAKELDRRKQPAGIIVKRSPKAKEELPPLAPEVQEAADEIAKKLVPILQRMGLGDVGLKIVQSIKNGGEGSYTKNLIKLAIDAGNPLETLHHESLHALKDLGFFTDQQWATLENQAKKTWIDKYLKNVQSEITTPEGEKKTMSRYDAYVSLGYTPEEIMEEAIADAFADFATTKPPGGMIASIMKRLNDLFKAIKNAFTRSGFESAEDIFGKAQRGELRPTQEGTEAEKLALAKPKSDIGHRREISTGRYVGAPDWVGSSPSQLANLRKKLFKLAQEGEVGRYWYENSSKAILNMVGGDKKEAEKIVSLIAIYSPNATVPANTSMALRAYYQYKTGQKISAGLGEANKKAEELLVENKPWSGIKTNSFYQNLMVEIDPSKLDPGVATMDMWMALAFDYGMKALDQGPKYKFAEREIQNIAAKLGWDAHQVQAAIWTAMKGRIDPIRNALKAKELELGIGRMVEKDGKQVYQIYPDKRYDHFRLAHKMGMEYDLKKEDLEESKYDFSNALDDRTAQLSWEATPGKTSGVLPGLLDAPTSQKIEYLQAISKVLTDKDGQDVIANKIGLPSGKTILGFSAWQGDTGAGAQTFTAVALEGQKEKRDVTPESRQLLNLYCAIKGYVLTQEAVVWQLPVFDGSAKNQNGIQIKFNRGLNEEEMSKLYADIHNKFGTWELAPGYLDDGVRILNFTDISNKNYREGMQEIVDDLPDDFGGGVVDLVSYRSVGDYISNDWTQAPTGEQYAEQIAKAANEIGGRERSDLPQWSSDLRSRVEAVNERFSKEYGWGNPKVGKTEEKLSLRSTRQPPESKEFKNWFTGSYFTSKGEPLVMYHGTARDITIFKGKQAKAIFVTTDPEVAHTYADMGVDYMRTEAYKALTRDEKVELITTVAEQAMLDGTINARELKEITNELKKRVPPIDPEKNRILDLPYQIEGEIIESLNNLLPTKGNIMPVYVNAKNIFDYANKDDVNRVYDWMMNNSSAMGRMENPEKWLSSVKSLISRGNWPRIESPEVQEAIRALGYDGFSVLEAGTKNYAVYNPTAIKSVTGNIGTFGLGEVSTEQAARFGMTPEQARQAQAEGDIRFSLKKVPVGIPENVWDLHNAYQEAEGKATGTMTSQQKTAATKAFKRLSKAAEAFTGNEQDALKLMQEMNTISGIRQAMAEDDTSALDTYKISSPALWRQETGEKLSLRNSTPAALNAAIDRTTYVREEKGFVERLMDAISPKSWSDFRAKAMNRYDAMSLADKKRAQKMGGAALLADQSAEAAALMSDLAAGVTASALGVHDRHGGVPVFRNGITTIDGSIKGPVAIFAPLAKYGDPRIYQMWQFYAGAKRARRFYKDGKEQNYTPADMALADQMLKQYPEFKQIFEEWNKFNDALVQYQVDTGVLSKERADEYRKYSDYIPFYRQLEDENTLGPKVFQSISGVKQGKKLKGSEAPIADLMETIVRNVQSGIQAGMKNTAAQRAIKVFEDIGEAVPTHPTDTGPSTVYALVNGEKKAYIVADPALYNSMQSLNLPDLPFLGFFAGPANLLRNLVTKDPGFMLANMVRDSMSAWVTSGVKMTPVASAVKNFTGALRGTSPEFQALLNAGVLGGYEFSQNVEASGKQLQKELAKYGPSTTLGKIKKPFTSVWEALEKGTTASDAATRMEVYKNVLAETGNEAEATFRALEVMNFNRKGSSAVIRIMTAAVPFLNARIQGLDVLYRASFGKMATQDAKAIQKSFFIRGATIMAMSMMYWGLTHDDDDYKKQEQETRDNYWLVPSLGIKIPIPFEVGVIFKVIPERIAELTMGTDTTKDFADAMKRNLQSTFAFNPIPQVVLPLVEARTNYSFFTGRAIIGQGLEGVAKEFQVGPSTSRLAKWLGSVTGESPMMIDHIIGGYTGTFGMYAVDAIDAITASNSDVPKASKRFEQMPVLRRFLLDPEARGNVTAYYDLKNATDEAVRTSNFLERTMSFEDLSQYSQDTIKMLASADLVKSMDKDMKELNEAAVAIRSSGMDADTKRDLLVSLNQAQNNMVANIKLIKKSMD